MGIAVLVGRTLNDNGDHETIVPRRYKSCNRKHQYFVQFPVLLRHKSSRLILVILHKESGVTCCAGDRSCGILALGRKTVGLRSLQQLTLSGLHVFATPRLQGGCLKRSSVAEGEGPGLLANCAFVDGIQVNCGLLFGLSTREEADSRDSCWNGTRQGQDCCLQENLR